MGKSKADLLVDELQTVKPVRKKVNRQQSEQLSEGNDYDVAKVVATLLLASLACVGVYHLITLYDDMVKFVGVPIVLALAYIVLRDK